MFDFFALASNCDAACRKENSLKGVLFSQEFEEFLTSSTLRSNVDEMLNAERTIGANQTAQMYSDSVVRHLDVQRGWTIILSKYEVISSKINFLPSPSIIGPVNNDSRCEISVFDMPKSALHDPKLCKDVEVSFVEKVFLKGPQFWANTKENRGYTLDSSSKNVVFLRISGPETAPYVHTFDRGSRSYVYSSFSSAELTSADIFSRLVKELMYEGINEAMSFVEVNECIDFLSELINLNEISSVSRWKLIQALSILDPEITEKFLVRLSKLEGPLKMPAIKALKLEKPGICSDY